MSLQSFFAKAFLPILLLLTCAHVNAQFSKYRITEEGEYQYLANAQAVASVFDETQGTVYSPITARTFFLQAHEEGYLPAHITYENFTKLTLKEQQALITPAKKPLDCSIGQVIPEGCLVYYGEIHGTNKQNNSAKKSTVQQAQGKKIESVKLILNEE